MKNLITAGFALGLISVTALAQAQTAGQDNPSARTPAELENTQETIAKWVDTRSDIAKERNDWREQKRLLEQQIALFQSEFDDLEKEINDLTDKAAQGQNRRAELSNEMEKLQRSQSVVEGQLGKFERQLRELSAFFPQPLLSKLSTLLPSLPTDPRNVKSGVGQRMAVIVGILNEVDKFNNDVTVVPEMRDVGGEQKQVNVMYLGLGEAFYADSEGKHAGIGTPAKGNWTWEDRDDLAPQIAKAIAVGRQEIKPAVYAEVPLKVTTVDTAR